MMDENESEINFLKRKIKESGVEIKGPVETQYGWGWAPTDTYWLGQRRIHLYFDLAAISREDVSKREWIYILEVADLDLGRAKRISYKEKSNEFVWKMMRLFLIEQKPFDELPGEWTEDNLDSDKFIPHPADWENPGNIVQLIGKMKKNGATEWKPDDED